MFLVSFYSTMRKRTNKIINDLSPSSTETEVSLLMQQPAVKFTDPMRALPDDKKSNSIRQMNTNTIFHFVTFICATSIVMWQTTRIIYLNQLTHPLSVTTTMQMKRSTLAEIEIVFFSRNEMPLISLWTYRSSAFESEILC